MKKWTKKEMKQHGWEVYYYAGWHIDLCAPKGLGAIERSEYFQQKAAYLNSLDFRGKKSSTVFKQKKNE